MAHKIESEKIGTIR